MESIEVITKNDKETKKLGEKLAKELLVDRGPTSIKRGALIISLEGDLGAGKTTFTQGFARGLGVKETPKSPTFVIMRVYSIKNKKFSNFLHIDAYRISEKDLRILGWSEFIRNPENIILVEWGDIIKKAIPQKTIRILFEHVRPATGVSGRSQSRLIKIIQ